MNKHVMGAIGHLPSPSPSTRQFPLGGCEGLPVREAEVSLKLDPITHIVVSVRVRIQKRAN